MRRAATQTSVKGRQARVVGEAGGKAPCSETCQPRRTRPPPLPEPTANECNAPLRGIVLRSEW